MARGRVHCLWCRRANRRREGDRRELLEQARFVCGHPTKTRYAYCRRRHAELVRLIKGGRVVRSATHRFGLHFAYHQVEVLDRRMTPRRPVTKPAEKLLEVIKDQEILGRTVRLIPPRLTRVWRGRSGPDRYGVWRERGDIYELVVYQIERHCKAWVPVSDAAADFPPTTVAKESA